MNIALIADWLPTYGGAEHVVSAFHELWPEAPIFTTVAASPEKLGPLSGADIRPDKFLQRIYGFTGRHQYLLPWMPRAVERINLEGYDVILSSSHAVAKGVIPPQTSVHVCYCHTPMRYAWEMEEEYLKDFRIRGLTRMFVRSELKKIRRWDLSTARRVDYFIANSNETRLRIERIYGRESTVIPPPVQERFFETGIGNPNPNPNPYFLALGRLVPYKRFDLLIEAANKMKFHLKIGGTGTDMARLKKIAGPTGEVLGFVSDKDLPELYANADCLLFPQVEDAGIVPLEAQASGIPVIAYAQGGILDVVTDEKTGLLVPEQTIEAFASAIEKFRSLSWDSSAIRESARQFSEENFREKIKQLVLNIYRLLAHIKTTVISP